jgi:hypothetical protein
MVTKVESDRNDRCASHPLWTGWPARSNHAAVGGRTKTASIAAPRVPADASVVRRHRRAQADRSTLRSITPKRATARIFDEETGAVPPR